MATGYKNSLANSSPDHHSPNHGLKSAAQYLMGTRQLHPSVSEDEILKVDIVFGSGRENGGERYAL